MCAQDEKAPCGTLPCHCKLQRLAASSHAAPCGLPVAAVPHDIHARACWRTCASESHWPPHHRGKCS